MKVLVAGELNPDLIMSNGSVFPEPGKEVRFENIDLVLGSSSAICAVGLARLGNEVTFVGTVGWDPYGDFCLEALRHAGVDVSLVQRRADLKTGITVSITSAKDRALVTYTGATTALTADDLPDAVFAGHSHFHVSSWFLQDGLRPGLKERFAAAHRAGLTTSLDPGYDPSEKWRKEIFDVLGEVDVFLPNESEIQGITRRPDIEAGIRELDNGNTLVIGKLGSGGCVGYRQGDWVRLKAFPIDVVDATGAGDSFNAGFLHTWLRGEELPECMRFASACGALSTQGLGGTAAQPSEQAARHFLLQAGNRERACSS